MAKSRRPRTPPTGLRNLRWSRQESNKGDEGSQTLSAHVALLRGPRRRPSPAAAACTEHQAGRVGVPGAVAGDGHQGAQGEGSDRAPAVEDARGHPHQAAVHVRRPGAAGAGAGARHLPVHARALRLHVHGQALDRAAVRGLQHGRGVERLLPQEPGRWPAGPERGLRPGHASRLRLGPPARPRRRGHGGRAHRLDRRHEGAVRRHPAGQDVGVHDHERRRAAHPGHVHRHGRGAGRGPEAAVGHHPERHPEGVHGAQHLHLPALAQHAHHPGHLRLHVRVHAQVQLHLHLRVPHAGGGRRRAARARLHDRRWHRVREGGAGGRPGRGRRGPETVLLLRDRHELLHGSGQAARGEEALGQLDEGQVRAEERQESAAADALPDVGLLAD
ncbi:hypothetical protein ON010_g10690 [Phytophthora cinnamomi]|nr:hypothetical protein ON010_g10690 [Phytophthora cinnamomi]